MNERSYACQHCGHIKVEYRHGLTSSLINGLKKLAPFGTAHLSTIDLTYSEHCNFQKLQYWGLVEKVPGPDGQTRTGVWSVTPLGRDFLSGNAKVQKHVWTLEGVPQEFDGQMVCIDELEPGFARYEDYVATRRPVEAVQ